MNLKLDEEYSQPPTADPVEIYALNRLIGSGVLHTNPGLFSYYGLLHVKGPIENSLLQETDYLKSRRQHYIVAFVSEQSPRFRLLRIIGARSLEAEKVI